MSTSLTAQLSQVHDELLAAAAILYAFDAAFPAPASVYKANGGIAENVYVSGAYAQDAARVTGSRNAGLGPWPNYERGLWELVDSGNDYQAGVTAGQIGIADAIRCGFPANGSIWFPFSIDVSLDPTRYGEAGNAFRGIQAVNAGRYRISCYGQGGLISYLKANGFIHEKGWLSASTSFPGYNASSPDVCIWQQIGNFIPGYSTDRNVITDPYALGAWWPAGSPYLGGDQFMWTDAEQAEILAVVRALSRGYVPPGGPGGVDFSPKGEMATRIRSVDTQVDRKVSDVLASADVGKTASAQAVVAAQGASAKVSALDVSMSSKIAELPTAAEIAALINATVTLSDAQVADLAAKIAAMTTHVEYTGTTNLTPVTPS